VTTIIYCPAYHYDTPKYDHHDKIHNIEVNILSFVLIDLFGVWQSALDVVNTVDCYNNINSKPCNS